MKLIHIHLLALAMGAQLNAAQNGMLHPSVSLATPKTARTSDLMRGLNAPVSKAAVPRSTSAPTVKGGGLTINQSFPGTDYQDIAETGQSADGSAGSCQFLLLCKGRLRSFNKFTGLADGIINMTMDRFFAPVFRDAFASDPMCVYDSFAQRWIIFGDTVNLPLAISDNGDGTGDPITPNTLWHYYTIDTVNNPAQGFTPGQLIFWDYTTLGFDQNYIYLAVNVENVVLPFFYSSNIYAIPTSSVATGGPATIYAFRNLVQQSTYSGPVYNWPAINYDADPTHAFIVGVDAAAGNTSNFFWITTLDLTGSQPVISAMNQLVVEDFSENIPVTPPGTPQSHAILPAPPLNQPCEIHARNNTLHIVHNIACDDTGASTATTNYDRNGIRFYAADLTDPNNPTLLNQGALFDSTNAQLSYMTPAMMSNSDGVLIIGATRCGPNNYLDAVVAQVVDGEVNAYPATTYTNSTSGFNAINDWEFTPFARWGDHSRVSLDPDGITMWACQQWCAGPNSFGIQIAQVAVD